MNEQVIPAEAVEAAAKAIEDRMGGPVRLQDLSRIALEAAAPYMRAGATVSTEEELDALPGGTVVLSEEVTHHEGGWALSYQRWQDGDWHRGARSGSTHPDNFLPVTILHVPQ